MIKDFKKWHKNKEHIHNERPRVFFHEREVWFCFLGVNVGFEQDGQGDKFLRPIVILRKFNNEVFWGIPLTRTHKEVRYYFKFPINNKKSIAIISQLRLADAKRLLYKIGDMKEEDFSALKHKIKALLP